jgi:hypothetical protein
VAAKLLALAALAAVFVFNLTFTGWRWSSRTRIVEVQVRDPLFYAGWRVRFEPE